MYDISVDDKFHNEIADLHDINSGRIDFEALKIDNEDLLSKLENSNITISYITTSNDVINSNGDKN